MQQEFLGLPKGLMEVHEWYPKVYQTSTFPPDTSENNHIKIRHPYNRNGIYVVMGQLVFAQANIIFDAAGSANQPLRLLLPLPYFDANFAYGTSGASTMTTWVGGLAGQFWYDRGSGIMATGVLTAENERTATFRAGSSTSDNGFGASPALTVTAADKLSLQLMYIARV